MLLLQLFFSGTNPYLLLLTFALFVYLAIWIPGEDSEERPTAFFSEALNRNIVYGSNHFAYVLLMFFLVLSGVLSIFSMEVSSLLMGLYFWATVGITGTFSVNLSIMVYGILTNTTPSEMFESHKHIHLWKKINYLPHRQIVMR